jgi:hypothetical protein
MSSLRQLLKMLGLALATAIVIASPASAAVPFGISNFDVTFTGPHEEEVTQAGSHPFEMTSSFTIDTETEGGVIHLAEPLKDIELSQIAGFIGDPDAVPRCSRVDFLTTHFNPEGVAVPSCADSSAVGVVGAEQVAGTLIEPSIWSAVFDLAPPPGVAAELGFWTGGVPVTIDVGVSESFPYEVQAHVRNISQVLEIAGSQFILWGIPADPVHNSLRGNCVGGKGTTPQSFGKCPAGIAKKPFLTLPRACNGPLPTSFEADSWEHPGIFSAKGSVLTHDSSEPPNPQGMIGCGKLHFEPEVQVTPGSSEAESAAGVEIGITGKDEELANPEGIANADIQDTEFAFPAGMTLNPSAAEGLGVCSKAQFEAESLTLNACPPASKLGSLEADTPILENHTLNGAVFLAEPFENPFATLLAAYLVIRDPQLGVFVKLASEIKTNEASGQVIASVKDMPPFPLSRVRVALRSGPRAPFVTPPSCGTYETEASLTPSSGGPVQLTHPSFAISSGPGGSACPAGLPFDPGFEAGTANNAAGSYSPFDMRLTRGDGQQDITSFSAVLPPGVTGKIAGLSKCPDAAIEAARQKSGRQELASPSCPASSQVGTVLGGAGVGTELTYVPGSLYLAGPYKGAPLSIAAIVPAVAGPFDVGTVVTRVGLDLNEETAQVQIDGAASDPIPHILKGIPLKLRDLRVFANRPQFTLNATNCQPLQGTAQIFGSGQDPFNPADDTSVTRSARYQAASCASLPFKPKLAVSLKGGMKRSGHPQLKAVLTARPGDANIGAVSTTLPHSEFIDPERVANPCTRVQFRENACPPASVLGTATAYSPLLDEPLTGPVYFRSNGGEREIPDIVAAVSGEGFHITQVGFVDSVKERIRTRFLSFPDAPVTKVVLTLKGGSEGVIENSANLCKAKRHVKVSMTGQNGRKADSEPVMGTSCKGKGKSARRALHSQHR